MTVAIKLAPVTPIPVIRMDHPVIEVGRDRASALNLVLSAEMNALLAQSSYLTFSKTPLATANVFLHLDDRIGAISNVRSLLDEGRLEDAERAYMAYLAG